MDVAEKLGMGAQHYTIPDFRMTVSNLVAGSAQGYAVQETDVVSDDGCFADDNVGGMVHEKSVTDFCSRMEIHAEFAADDVLEHFRRKAPVFFPEYMGYTVGLQSLEALKKQQRLQVAGASGVA